MFGTHSGLWNKKCETKSALIWDFQLSISAIYIRIARRILHLPPEILKIPKNISKIKFSLFQKLSAIDVWDYSFPEAKAQWRCFKLMTYLEENSCYTILMNRFREIASVRLPANRFRRRHMSPKGIRPGIGAGGEPSTWLPPEGLVEQSRLWIEFV